MSKMNDDLISEGLHEAFCPVRDDSVEYAGVCTCRLRKPAAPESLEERIEESAEKYARERGAGVVDPGKYYAYESGARWGLKQGAAELRLANTIIEQLQRAQKASNEIKDNQYISAVNGRKDFRNALQAERDQHRQAAEELREELRAYKENAHKVCLVWANDNEALTSRIAMLEEAMKKIVLASGHGSVGACRLWAQEALAASRAKEGE